MLLSTTSIRADRCEKAVGDTRRLKVASSYKYRYSVLDAKHLAVDVIVFLIMCITERYK